MIPSKCLYALDIQFLFYFILLSSSLAPIYCYNFLTKLNSAKYACLPELD